MTPSDQTDGRPRVTRLVQAMEPRPVNTPARPDDPFESTDAGLDEVVAQVASSPRFEEWVRQETGLSEPDLRAVIRTSMVELAFDGGLSSVEAVQRRMRHKVRFHHANLLAAAGKWDRFFKAPLFTHLARTRFVPRVARDVPVHQDPRYQAAMCMTWERTCEAQKNPEDTSIDPTKFFYDRLKWGGRNVALLAEGALLPVQKDAEPEEEALDERLSYDTIIQLSLGFASSNRCPQEDQVRAAALTELFTIALDGLPPGQKEAVYGLAVGEKAKAIALRMGVSAGTVYSSAFSGRANVIRGLVARRGAQTIFEMLPDELMTHAIRTTLVRCEAELQGKGRERGAGTRASKETDGC